MVVRTVFVFVSAATLVFAQAEAPAPSGAAAKVTLPPAGSAPPPSEGAEQPTPPQAPAPAPPADSAQTAPKPAAEAPAAVTPKPAPAKAPAVKAEKKAVPGHKPYVFGPLDVVLIKVYNQPTLTGAFDVSSDGFISIPLVGEIKADGLTAKEINEELTQRLKDCCIKDPEGEVSVDLGKNHSKRFYVLGGVGRPGEYPLDRDDETVMEALSDVGGFHEFAKKKKIRIQRKGQAKEILFNYIDVSKGRHMEQDIVIQNGDRIYVDE
jgi:polysaccharide biosynthesis/export protein